MGRGCWFIVALLSGFVAVGSLFAVLVPPSGDTQTDTESLAAIMCCSSLLFAAFSLYSLSMITKIGKEQKKEKREQAMLQEMQMLRQQVGQQQRPQQPQVSEDDMQIKLAGKLWKEGKKTAAIEILESMPFNDRAQAILNKLRTGKQ